MANVVEFSPAQQPEQEYPEPQKIMGEISGKPFEPVLKLLPSVIREAVEEISEGLNVPHDMVFTSIMGVIATVAQALFLVKIDKDKIGPLSLFMVTILESGGGKTQVDKKTGRAIRGWCDKQEKLSASELEDYDVAMEGWESERKGYSTLITKSIREGKMEASREAKKELKKLPKSKPTAPIIPDLINSDATHEALTGKSGLLAYPVMCLHTDEGGIFFSGAAFASGQAASGSMGKYNSLWSNAGFDIKRQSAGKMRVRDVGLSQNISVQPVIIDELFERHGSKVRDSGYFARTAVCQPESRLGQQFYKEPNKDGLANDRFNARITELLDSIAGHITDARRLQRDVLTLSAEALKLWIEYNDDVQLSMQVGGEHEFVRPEAARAAEMAARFADNFHAFEIIEEENREISEEYMRAGCAVSAWYMAERKRLIYRNESPKQFKQATEVSPRLAAYCRRNKAAGKKNWNHITIRQALAECTPKDIGTQKDLRPVLTELMDADHVIDTHEQERGSFIEVNPRLLELYDKTGGVAND